MNTRKLWSLTVVLLSGGGLSGCDWVDSTGNQNEPGVVTEVFLDDTPAGDVNVLNENVLARITTVRQNSAGLEQTFSWSEKPLEQGNLSECADQNGFKPDLAADTLAQACKVGVDCQLEFKPVEQDTTTETDFAVFNMQVPVLDASIGLRYQLNVQDSSGQESPPREYTFCLIAVNEAPVAVDDTFVVTEGSTLNVTPSTVNLLSNDYDDTDVSNTEFVTVPQALVEPKFAAFFEMSNDGSFTYQSNLENLREDQFDGFEYQLSDGLFTSKAKVTIRVVAANQAPQLLTPISLLLATEGVQFSADLAANFIDPENGTMTFSLAALTPLVTGTGLSLSPAGLFSGTPTAADVGNYELTLLVSDGGLTTEAPLSLNVAAAPVVVLNEAPVFVTGSVFNQSVGRLLAILPIRSQFTDADNDVLTYSMAGAGTLPLGVTLNSTTGVISGIPRVAGVYRNLRVRATDPSGATALSTIFSITVLAN